MKRRAVANLENKDVEQGLSGRSCVVRKGWDDEFLNESYMSEVRSFELLTHAQEIELGKAIEPMIIVRKRINAISERLVKDKNGYRESDSEKRKKLKCELEQCRKEESLICATEQFQNARNALVAHNLRWVIAIAKKFRGKGMPFKDVIQEGNIGLIKAAEKYEWNRGFRFCTYSAWWIRQSIARAIGNDRVVHLPAHIVDLLPRVMSLREAFVTEHGYEPSYEYLAERCKERVTTIERVLSTGYKIFSMESSAKNDSDLLLKNILATDGETSFDGAVLVLLRERFAKMLHVLTPMQREVVERRFGLNTYLAHTLEEIAELKGFSRERIRQIEKETLGKLRMPHNQIKLNGYL